MPSGNSPSLKEDRAHGTGAFRCAFYTVDPTDESFHVTPHWHDELEMIHFQKGSFILEINMERYTIEEECIFFVNSGELHRITCEESCLESAVVFSPYLLSFVTNDAAQGEVILPLARQTLLLPRCIHPEDHGFSSVLQEFQRITGIFADNEARIFDKSQQLFIKAALLNILAHLSANGLLQTARAVRNESIEGIKTILTYIHEHYAEKIFIRDLAGILNLNEQYFCRFFKKAVGQTPVSYINQYRVRRATFLLEKTSLPVTDVCLECGFNNVGNFLKEFRKQTGETPLQYRLNHS